jgi:hypothetical protein
MRWRSVLKACCSVGRAIFTAVWSRTAMKVPSTMAASGRGMAWSVAVFVVGDAVSIVRPPLLWN